MNTNINETSIKRELNDKGRAIVANLIAQTNAELAVCTDVDAAADLYLPLANFCKQLDIALEPFGALAPLVQASAAEVDAAMTRAEQRRINEEEEDERKANMTVAKICVEAAIAVHGKDSIQARVEMAKAIEFLPDEEKAKLDASARELGLMPAASGYTDDGEPVFSVEAIAAHFGMNPAEVEETAGDLMMTVDGSTVHTRQ